MHEQGLQDIHPGDHVILTNAASRQSIHTVERVTKTQIILRNGERFRRSDGYPVGSSPFTQVYIQPATDELAARVADEQMRYETYLKLNSLALRVTDPDTSLDTISNELSLVRDTLNQAAHGTTANQ